MFLARLTNIEIDINTVKSHKVKSSYKKPLEVFCEKVSLKISEISPENTCVGVSFS